MEYFHFYILQYSIKEKHHSLFYNYFPTNHDTYQATTTSTSYEANTYTYPTTYTNTISEYNQSAIEETTYNGQEYQTYENTASLSSLNNNILPTITPAEPIETNINNETHRNFVNSSALNIPSDKGINAVRENQSETITNTKLTDSNNNKQNLQQTTTSVTQSNIKTSQNLQTQKENVSPQTTTIDELELQKLKEQAAEAAVLREQLAQLEPLKKQIEEMAELKKQLSELDDLREKAAELDMVKSQLEELKELRQQDVDAANSQLEELKVLRQQVGQMNILRQQIEELNTLRSQVAITENLKRRVEELEEIKIEYELEIKKLREAQMQTEIIKVKSNSNVSSKVLESKQPTFEEKTEEICVKGDIIHDTNELEMLTRKINKLNKKLTFNLLYKASADTDRAAAFHAKCDDANSTIVLVETDKGKRFGGYTTCSWSGDCIDKKDENAFVFSFDTMKTYDNIPGEDAIGCYPRFGPIFLGCQIRIYDKAFSKGGTTFERGLNYNTEEDYELTGGDRIFNVKEIEVYEVIPQ